MPFKPPHPCNHPGCPALVRDGAYCDDHKKERGRTTDERRGSREQRGYTWRWRKYRAWFLNHHPVCVAEGCGRPAEHVDHIKRINGQNDPLFWKASNHQPLCASCHSRKTATESPLPHQPGGAGDWKEIGAITWRRG